MVIIWYKTVKENCNCVLDNNQTFDSFYNKFLKFMNKVMILYYFDTWTTWITSLGSNGHDDGVVTQYGHISIGRGRVIVVRGPGRIRVRGYGGLVGYNPEQNPYSVERGYVNFRPEAKN